MVCTHEKKIIQLDIEERKQNDLVIKLKLRGREVVEKDVHDKSKLTDFGEECSWQVRTYIDFGEVQWC